MLRGCVGFVVRQRVDDLPCAVAIAVAQVMRDGRAAWCVSQRPSFYSRKPDARNPTTLRGRRSLSDRHGEYSALEDYPEDTRAARVRKRDCDTWHGARRYKDCGIYADVNDNGQLDKGEPTARTKPDGSFLLE